MEKQISIACLPVAGKDNPYQYLMIEGLNSSEINEAFNGVDDKFFGILKTTIKYKPDYLHLDWITAYYLRRQLWMTILLLPLFYFQIYFINYFTKTKIVWTLHNITPHDAKHLWLHKKVRGFLGKHCEWIRVFSRSSISRAMKELNCPKDIFIVVPEGDYTSVYPNNIDTLEARNMLQIPHNKITLLYLGFIKPYKGLENLIHQFSRIENKQIELILAGKNMNNPYVKGLERLISGKNEKRIRLITEFIPVEKLQLYYNAVDAVVLPFDKVENSGSAIMAMGFKKAILAPKMGVLKERLKQQDFMLYNDLFKGLNSIFALGKVKLVEIGNQNFLALQKHKWEDFNKYFI